MRFSVFAAAIIVSLAAVPALAQSIGERSGINSVTGVAPSTPDFVNEAGIAGMVEVQASQIALQKGVDDQTKAFAQRMITDHTKAGDELKAIATKANLQVPSAIDSGHQAKLDKLRGLSGEGFIKQYHQMMVDDHKDAVSLFERYSKGGDNAELKTFAAKTLPTLQDHYKMAQDLNK